MDNDTQEQFETAPQDLGGQESVKDSETDQDGTVKYTTYKKAVSQLKNQKGELEQLRAYKQQIEEDALAKKGDFEKLLATREERINDLQGKLDNVEKDRLEAKKLGAFIDKLPGKMRKQEYLSFLDTDSIQIDPQTGKVDPLSLNSAVDTFVKDYGDLIQTANPKGLPNVGHLGGKPNLKRNLKDLSTSELRNEYLKGNW